MQSRTRARLRRFGITATFAFILLFAGCNTVSTYMVDREDKRVPRDSDGIMQGAAARDLGPADAPNAVLFVHGYAGAGNNFNELPQQFADMGWRVHVMRLPGHGTSPRDLEKTTANELERAVLDEVRALKQKHQRVLLVGHSMGGTLSTIAASQTPVDGIILGGAYFGVTYRWYYGLRPETWTRLGSHLLRWVYKGQLFMQVNDKSKKPLIVSYTWLPTKAGLTLVDLGKHANAPSVLENVRCPVLMFHSHGDIAASPEAAAHAFNAMATRDKRLVWVDRSNHHVFWDFDADIISARCAEFAKRFSATPN